MDMFIPTIFVIIIYWMAWLQPTAKAFFCNWLAVMLTQATAQVQRHAHVPLVDLFFDHLYLGGVIVAVTVVECVLLNYHHHHACSTCFVPQGFGLFVGAAVMNPKTAQTIAAVLMLVFMLISGYYVRNIPSWIGWLKYLSFLWYACQRNGCLAQLDV